MRFVCRFAVWGAFFALSSSSFAGSFSFEGNFLDDNDLQQFIFTIATPGTVTMQTWSFAGGTNVNATVIPPGGFAPVLALFDNTGTIVGNFDQGGTPPLNCGTRNIDVATGFCLDAYLSDNLGAGVYTLVLSQQDNVPLGQLMSDGYQHDGEPNFAGGFNDFGAQRNSSWAVDIVSVDSAAPVVGTPEPSSAVGCLAGLAWLAGMSRKRNSKG